MKTRKSTVQAKYQKSTYGKEKQTSGLRFGGCWLEEAGFVVGDQVEILIEKGELIIRKQC